VRELCTLVVLIAFGCGGRDAYQCTSSDQCVGNGAAGVCESSGYCSFEDPSCPGGRKYEENAGGGLGGMCVASDAGIDDSSAACIAQVAHGRHFGCVLKKDGTVWCVGENTNGQIGFGLAGATNVTQWMQARDATTSMPIADATAIGSGSDTMCAVRAGGALWCWGRGGNGQIGDNTATDRPAAVQVRKETDDMPLVDIVEVSGGRNHTCARDTANTVWCWGINNVNQIGDATVTQRNRAVQVTTGVASLSLGRDTTCARKPNDEIICWGKNTDGLMGDGSVTNKPTPVSAGSAKQIAVGMYASCRLANGEVACAGNPWRGRVGNGVTNADPFVMTPVTVLTGPGAPPLANVVEIAAGGASCARQADGVVKCWTDNTHGQSGTGMGSPYAQTVKLANGAPLADATALWARFSHLCARRANGEIVCWGRNLNGELGDAKLEDRGAAAPMVFPCP
jgi:alpha-tubulin suppressor-like RCC1 family protein